MSQAGSIGGGAGGVVTSVVGQSSLVAPSITVTTVLGTATVEDRTWQTQYVVDPSATQGLRGTYQTIQDAIDQAVADGASSTVFKRIYIRYGSYTEDLTISSGIVLQGDTFVNTDTGVAKSPSITGNHTLAASSVVTFHDLEFISSAASPMFTTAGTTVVQANGCMFNNSGGDLTFTLDSAGSSFTNCSFVSTAYDTIIDATAQISFYECDLGTGGISSTDTIMMFYCQNVGPISLNTGAIDAYYCYFTANNTDNISGTGDATVYYCVFKSSDATKKGVNLTGSMKGIGNSISSASSGPGTLYPAGQTMTMASAQMGSIMNSRRSAVSTNVAQDDFYIGITSTAAARTVTLPSSGVAMDHVFAIKDESGACATNNITVTVNGGVKTIDGATTQAINVNYACMWVIYDGTNYFII